MNIDQTNALAALAGRRQTSLRAVPSAELVQLFQGILAVEGVKIGALPNLAGFVADVTHAIYFVKELDRNQQGEMTGHCVLLAVKSDGSVWYELSESLDRFWPFWESESGTSLGSVPEALDEIRFFFEHHGSLKTPRAYRFRDGDLNQRLHRCLRSEQKCKHLELVFGYRLTASDL